MRHTDQFHVNKGEVVGASPKWVNWSKNLLMCAKIDKHFFTHAASKTPYPQYFHIKLEIILRIFKKNPFYPIQSVLS